MSRLTDLLRQVRQADTQLAKDLEAEINQLTNRRTFGLVFEPHQPEAVELPGRSIRRGDKVRLLPPRGETKSADSRLWRVQTIESSNGQRIAHLLEANTDQPDSCSAPTEDLVVIAEFSDRIYPGLVETGRVERGGDKPFHTVINAENYHALQLLTYTHRQTIDAIYIDPPYNSGAKDWKYNNNYVEGDDDYRHSKWLAFMERRLKIARDLLNPDDSVLIVTIDEKEVHRLGLLLEQTFPEADIQMITSVINPSGSSRLGSFSRSDEYILFVFVGAAQIVPGRDDMLRGNLKERPVRWDGLARRGATGRRTARPNLFYPVFFHKHNGRYHSVGEPLDISESRHEVDSPAGTFPVFPISQDGSEATWGISHIKFDSHIRNGYLKFGPYDKKRRWRAIYHVQSGTIKAIEAGEIEVHGKNEDGTLLLGALNKPVRPMTTWNKQSHSAGDYGSSLLRRILPNRKFPFPKSLYAVEDTLRFFVKDKPEAKVLDFFAGSGTTAHAVMRLNKQDGGRRQSISVTNNEVSAEEQRTLRKAGLRPGDPDWEALGICDYVTKPRITAAITGQTPEGQPIKGDYRFNDEFPMADGFNENAAYFTLTYETPLAVRHHRAFKRIAPMLWLRAGAHGRIITDLGDQGWDIAQAYAVLANFDQTDEFLTAIREHPGCLTVYLITDDDTAFQMICRELPEHLRPVQLYESYLHNFTINQGQPH
ncbi:hypothetical protein GCM10023190_17870 [Enteractinococcus fodinae]|uniref:Adenine-specific DNA-methyltransferase n=1 Tax=Enteractinococcus fodinae TaxID=684663 RepID=A0ABU2B4C1_9MICC|nr:DNA methyltransferase [Enteractinococcus fodinae]MDR7348455.1 adenine-specific DNA-methyltransferase [Enteractinococcus fodinae]